MSAREELIEAVGRHIEQREALIARGAGVPTLRAESEAVLDAMLARRDLLLEALGAEPWTHYVNYQPHETMWRFPIFSSEGEN